MIGYFVNHSSHGTMTSIRTMIMHYGTFVHPENNPGLCDFYYKYSCCYSTWVSHGTVTLIRTKVVCYGTHVVSALCLLAMGPFRLLFELDS